MKDSIFLYIKAINLFLMNINLFFVVWKLILILILIKVIFKNHLIIKKKMSLIIMI